jgi:hypothetical protein
MPLIFWMLDSSHKDLIPISYEDEHNSEAGKLVIQGF